MRKLVGNLLGVRQTDDQRVDAKSGSIKEREDALDIPAVVQWQFDHHKGFVSSFVDTLANGPIMFQHTDWKRVCNIIRGRDYGANAVGQPSRLCNNKVLVITGESDSVVVQKDLHADLSELMEDIGYIDFRTVPGDHGFPVASSGDVIQHISEFWGLPPAKS